MQEGFAAGQRRAPLFHDSFDIFGMDERCPLPALQILQRLPYVPEPCLIEEIEVAVRPARVNQAGGRIDKELKVCGLIPSDGTISTGTHCSHYILFKMLFTQNARYGEIQVEYEDKGEIPSKANKHDYLSVPSF